MKYRVACISIFAALGCSGGAPVTAPDLGGDESDSPTAADGSMGLPTANDDAGVGDGGGNITVGGQAIVTASSLNLRDGVGTTANILTAMPCGATVDVVGGPSTTPVAGWWNVTYQSTTGWASGKYLVAPAAFSASICGGTPTTDGGTTPVTAADIFARAKLGVGYSYYWGHGSWRSDMTQLGSCVGSCPSCTHTGQYGADCS